MSEELTVAGRISDPQKTLVIAHYERAAPLMAADFPHIPLVSSYHPNGLGTPATFKFVWPEGLPHTMSPVQVTTPSGKHPYLGLTENAILWLAHRDAVGFLSWTPSPLDPERVGYARILLARCGTAGEEELKQALLAMRAMLAACGLQAIPVLDGHRGAALFVPFGDLPLYDAVREWLHALCQRAVERHAELVTIAAEAERGNRVHLAIETNAAGRASALPYSLAGNPGLWMVTPIEWAELAEVDNGTYTAHNSAQRLERDVFAVMTDAIGVQRFSAVR